MIPFACPGMPVDSGFPQQCSAADTTTAGVPPLAPDGGRCGELRLKPGNHAALDRARPPPSPGMCPRHAQLSRLDRVFLKLRILGTAGRSQAWVENCQNARGCFSTGDCSVHACRPILAVIIMDLP